MSRFREKGDALGAALHDCRDAARLGYEIAKANLDETAVAINGVAASVSGCLERLEGGVVRTPGIANQLREQIAEVVQDLTELQRSSARVVEERRARLDRFSVTLFGRTMTGKSTLMEILTRGDGRSIGKGAQRTTRDIRSYRWNGLEVTDVPGIAAFEGLDDEELAFKAAAQADLVLFLITDDAPQPVEAECLAQLRALGKPVLGICNVKVAVNDEDDLMLFLRDPDKPFDRARLEDLVGQFHEFADRYLPGTRIPFIFTHLQSQFLASRPKYARWRSELDHASRFGSVEARIVDEVIGRGRFLRIKSFVDGAVAPMLDLTERLLEFSARNSGSGRVLVDKKRQLVDWARAFRASGRERIGMLVAKQMESLRAHVPTFAEEHYEDEDVGAKWSKLVTGLGIERKSRHLQEQLCNECRRELNEIARELRAELALVSDLSAGRHLKADGIFDAKRVWNWGTNLLAGGLGMAALILGSGPLGWAAAAVGMVGLLVSFFFDDREEKARRARQKLEQRLNEGISRMENRLRRTLDDWFRRELLDNQISVLIGDLGAVTNGLFDLADAQRRLAWIFNDRQRALARTLVHEGLRHLDGERFAEMIKDVARLPGLATMLVIAPETRFPGRLRSDLEHVLGEPVWFVVDTQNPRSILAQALGRDCDRTQIRIEQKIRVAHVPIGELTPVARSRIRLAQQITGLHVMR